MSVRLLLLTPCVVIAGTARGQEAPSQALLSRIDALVMERMREADIPGVAIVIVHGDRLRHLRGFGVADDSGRPVTPETRFVLGSVTKSFTALAVMQLVEDGHVELDAPIQRYIPWFGVTDAEMSRRITVRHLFNHTSGLSTVDGNRHLDIRDTSDAALANRVRDLARARLIAPPGSRHQYSNANYHTLALLVEVVSGHSYETYVRERIFAPLGMGAGFASTRQWLPRDTAVGYRYSFGRPVAMAEPDLDRRWVGATGVTASADDMARYVTMLLRHGRASNGNVLTPAGIAELQRPAARIGETPVYYAMGWRIRERNGQREVFHTGYHPGFAAAIWMVPEEQLGFVLLANSWHNFVAHALASIFPGVQSLLAGRIPPPMPADGLARNVVGGLAATTFLVLSSVALTFRSLRRWRTGRTPRPRGTVRIAVTIILPFLFFVSLPYLLLDGFWRVGAGATLPAVFRFIPDVAWVAVAVATLAGTWGIVRTALVVTDLRRKAHAPADLHVASSLAGNARDDKMGLDRRS